MKYLSEFRDPHIAEALANEIADTAKGLKPIRLMEVCGTHTMAIHRYGIRNLLPENITLVSGPGCPVCVTPNEYLDRAIAFAKLQDVTICTFGDMLRVPGSYTSLEAEKAMGADIRIVYSPLDALEIAQDNPQRKIIFLAVGFETTVPTIAAVLHQAREKVVSNFFVTVAHKTMPMALTALVEDGKIGLNGFILPAHVSAIIGSEPYTFLSEKYNQACVVTGFEPLDVLMGILMLVKQIKNSEQKVEIQYSRVVNEKGNIKAQQIIEKVFQPCNAEWRGIGNIPQSGLCLRKEFANFDANTNFEVTVAPAKENPACICGLVLKGLKSPLDCQLFAKVCTPEAPVGACMVSSEGTCAAYFKYARE